MQSARQPARGRVVAAWWVLLGGLATFFVGLIIREPGRITVVHDVLAYNSVQAAAAVLCWYNRATDVWERRAWRWVGLFAAVLAVLETSRTLSSILLGNEISPLLSDAVYILDYVPFIGAVVALTLSRVRRIRTVMWLDALVTSLGLAAVVSAVAFDPLLRDSDGSVVDVLNTLAYPLADLLALTAMVGAVAVMGIRPDRVVVALGSGLVIYLLGDLAYLAGTSEGTYDQGGPLDLTWLTAMVVFALGAQFARTERTAVAAADGARLNWRVLVLPAAANAASLVLLVVGWGNELPLTSGICAATCVGVALARSFLTLRQVRDVIAARAQARTDELTSLANRRALFERCDALPAPGPGASSAPSSVLVLLDLNNFKEVNDALGHPAGDTLLRHVAVRLREYFADAELVARLGGDEFAVLLRGVGTALARERAEGLLRVLEEPVLVEGVRLRVGASVGVAAAAERGDLFRWADIAMYQAKRTRTGVVVFTPELASAAGDRLRVTQELHEAFDHHELLVHVQPQIDLRSAGLVGMEALVRWRHPTRGLLSPACFLDSVHQAGLQRRLVVAVVDRALGAAARWWADGLNLPVSVNLTAADVVDLHLPETLLYALGRHGLPPAALTVELTEDAFMRNPERGCTVLQKLRDAGIRVSIDDYGTGYASLAYLRSLPADELKLDRAFTSGVLSDPRAAAIVRHTSALAHDMGLLLVAEGIETGPVQQQLTALGCDRGQGYYIARPMPVDDLMEWLTHRHGFEVPVPRPSFTTSAR